MTRTSPTAVGARTQHSELVLDLSRAEHLANRFGFGAPLEELRELVGLRPAEVFEHWMERSAAPARPELQLVRWEDYGSDQDGTKIPAPSLDALERQAAKQRRVELRLIDKGQFNVYIGDWIDGMLAHRDPVRDRLALFWHGFFPTNLRVVRRRYECILQHAWLRQRALGSFTDLLRGIVRDPAMLGSFDNDSSSKQHPNENFARELLELYSLGEGHYSERDVREVARALTGYQGESGHFVLDPERHDFGEKRILGRRGRFDGDDLPELLVQQQACARHVSGKLLTFLEGVAPSEERTSEYADFLRESDHELQPFLRKLCCDPRFYRAEVIGSKVQGPLEWLIGSARRLGARPPAQYIYFAAAVLGQQLYAPPTVKGWDEGEAWLSQSTLLLRSKCLGPLVGRSVLAPAGEGGETAYSSQQEALIRDMHAQEVPEPDLSSRAVAGVGLQAGDRALAAWAVHEWLARAGLPSTQRWLRDELALLRAQEGVEGPLLLHPAAELVLRRLAHNLVSLPIAQLG